MHLQPASGARCLMFGRTFCLLPYFMYANSEVSGEAEPSLVASRGDKYHNLMSWLHCDWTIASVFFHILFRHAVPVLMTDITLIKSDSNKIIFKDRSSVFIASHTKSGGLLCYTVATLRTVRVSVCPSVHQRFVSRL